MSKQIPDYLRLHTEPAPLPPPVTVELVPGLADLCRSFEQATGWPLRFSPQPTPPTDSDVLWSTPLGYDADDPNGSLQINLTDGPLVSAGCEVEAAVALATSLAGMVQTVLSAQRLVWEREADLATGVPLVPHPEGRQRLPELLESLLETAAQTVGCQAAGLYMLDDATSELKLRAAWGLPHERFASPPRLLRESGADLEALSGHAVVLENAAATIHWKPPEECRSAICLPVSSAAAVLGTLWLYGARSQDFSDELVNLTEIVAGRIATELEREALAAEVHQVKVVRQQLDEAETAQRDQLPVISPLCDGWDVSGKTAADAGLASTFHDWFPVGSGEQLAITLGEIESLGLTGALQAGNLRTSFRVQGDYTDDPIRMLASANRALWASSSAGQQAAAFCGVIEPNSGVLHYASAGSLGMLHVQRQGAGLLLPQPHPLGMDPETTFGQQTLALLSEEMLLVGSDAWRKLFEEQGASAVAELWRSLQRQQHGTPPAALFDTFRRRLETSGGTSQASSRSLLMIRSR